MSHRGASGVDVSAAAQEVPALCQHIRAMLEAVGGVKELKEAVALGVGRWAWAFAIGARSG